MCGRYVAPDQAAIERYWHIGRDNGNPFAERYNVAPQQGNPVYNIPVIRHDRDGKPALVMMQWWLLPYWTKEPRVKYSTFNARIETVATAAAFKGPFQRRRCLIPALGWYEWQPTPSGKQPWYMHSSNGELLHFAGVWDHWKGGDESTESCSIIVGDPHPSLAKLHDRMPLVLRPEFYSVWLDRNLVDVEKVKELLQLVPESAIAYHKVSARVSNSRNEGAELIETIEG